MEFLEGEYLYERRWAIAAISIGIFLGLVSALICIIWHLVIFGFNIMYIVSPLLAGVVETYIARKKYGRSTGAISALLTFLLINIYGWFLPGTLVDPTKEPASLSLITIIAILLTLQAAFPTLMNYILFVVGVGIFRKFIELLLYIPARIQGKSRESEQKEEIIVEPSVFDNFLDELDVPLLSVTPQEDGIKKYVGVVTGVAVAKEKESEGRVAKLTKIIEPTTLDDMYLEEARKVATSRMLDHARSLGANTVIDVKIEYVSMGGLQGSALLVTATGTAVIADDGYKLKRIDRMDVSGLEIGDLSVSNNVKEFSDSYIDNDELSAQIEEYLNENSRKIIEYWQLATKSDINVLEKKFSKVTIHIDGLDQRFDEYKSYNDNKFENIENRLNTLESDESS
ncbi:MAG: YbjQ family protein [Methanobacterium sp.]